MPATPRVIRLSSPATGESWPVPVLFEDAEVLALDKPARLLSSPDRYDSGRPNLMRLLHDGVAAGKPWAAEHGITYLANAHRLDFETTGIFLLAKTREALVQLANHFGSEIPKKTYLALVLGNPERNEFTVENRLASHWFKPGLMAVSGQGKRAVTHFRVAERFAGCSLVECRPLTGRTHQLRVHLQDLGHPICGDAQYGGEPLLLSRLKRGYRLAPGVVETPLIRTLALHAWRLELPHPATGEPLRIEAPLPKPFAVALKNLRRFATHG
jgi:RluA family pseudouridine synthase